MKKNWEELERDDDIYCLYFNLQSKVFGPIMEKVSINEIYDNKYIIIKEHTYFYYSSSEFKGHDPLHNTIGPNGIVHGIIILGFDQESIINRCKFILKDIYSKRKDEILNSHDYKFGIKIDVSADKLDNIKIPKTDDPNKEIKDLKSEDAIYGVYMDSDTAKFRLCSTKFLSNCTDIKKYTKEVSPYAFEVPKQHDDLIYYCSLCKATEYIKNRLNELFIEKVQPKIEELEQLDNEYTILRESLLNPGKAVE